MKLATLLLSLVCLLLSGCGSPKAVSATSSSASRISSEKWFRDEAGNVSSGVKPVGKNDSEICDPLEDEPQFAEAFRIASRDAEAFVSENGRRVKPAYLYYNEKKRILRERFHIDWKTPMELNPWVKFD